MSAVGLKPTCRARAPTGPWLGGICTGEGRAGASSPGPPGVPGEHSRTHTPRAPRPEPEGPMQAGPGDGGGHCTHTAPCLLPRGQERQGQGHRPNSVRFSTESPGPARLRQAHHCPCWCPSPKDARSWCGCPCTQAAPCPLPPLLLPNDSLDRACPGLSCLPPGGQTQDSAGHWAGCGVSQPWPSGACSL